MSVAQDLEGGELKTAHPDEPSVHWLWGVQWSADRQLEALANFSVRYIAPQIAFIDGDETSGALLMQRGFQIVFSDRPNEGEAYFLSDHLELPLAQGLTLVYRDVSDWALLRLARQDLLAIQDVQHFLWPLPEEYALEGWRTKAVAKPAAVLQVAAVEDLLASVDMARIQQDVAALTLKDPALGSTPENLRTRYARRQETFESTTYVRDRLAEVLGEAAVGLEEFQMDPDEPLMYNVIGELSGWDPDAGYYVICAHYDAVGTRTRGGWDWRTDPAPGADDNASGVALVLESARVLAQRRFPWGIRFVAFSGEELGLWGSRHHAEAVAERDERVLGVMNFDMIGFNDLSHRLELVTNRASRWLVDELMTANERYNIGLRIDVLEDEFARLSDHAPFWARGYDAILGIENYLPTNAETDGVVNGLYRLNTQYHTVVDVPDSINWELVGSVTRLAVATLGQYGLAQYGLANGLPNLAVFPNDIRGDSQDDLRVRISNLGLARLAAPYTVRVARCELDSSACKVIFEVERSQPLEAGAGQDITVPWQRFGEMVFRIEVDPEDRIAESEEGDNLFFQRTRLVPRTGIVVFPNPFQPTKDCFLAFSGVPLNAQVRIANLNGEVVWSAQEDVGEQRNLFIREIVWSGVNQVRSLEGSLRGRLVASGVYIYTVTDAAGNVLKRDKIAVVR